MQAKLSTNKRSSSQNNKPFLPDCVTLRKKNYLATRKADNEKKSMSPETALLSWYEMGFEASKDLPSF